MHSIIHSNSFIERVDRPQYMYNKFNKNRKIARKLPNKKLAQYWSG